jgi:hypothetical protein
VLQTSDKLGFTKKEPASFSGYVIVRIKGSIGPDNLDCDFATQLHIFRKIYVAHAATSQQTSKAILTELLSFYEHSFSPIL